MSKKKKKALKKNNITEIFKAFLKVEPQFKAYLGYGREEIEEIGVCKFIKTMDWTKVDQVNSWKTDTLHIVPCHVCGKEFAIQETDFGICGNCKKDYDMVKLDTFMRNARYSGDQETWVAANAAIRDHIFLDGHFKKNKEDEIIGANFDNKQETV